MIYQGVWELRQRSSYSPFLKLLLLLIILNFLILLILNGLNLPKLIGLQSIIGTRILIKLNYINQKRIAVIFKHAGVIGPKLGRKNINTINEISNKQKGYLEITYLSNRIRIYREAKGKLFLLRKINTPTLFKSFEEFIKSFNHLSQFFIQIDFKTK